jgi:phage host-nuclease inhibitor protein Gam
MTETSGAAAFNPAPIPTEAELASFDHRTVPSPIEVIGNVQINAEPTFKGLSPEMQERVSAKMAGVKADHEIFERQFIMEELAANSYRLKVLAGPGKNANEYQRECFGIMREIYDLESEAARIEAELNDTVGYGTDYDGDGNPIAVPVYRFAPETRQGRQEALRDVRYRISQVEREAPARRTAARDRMAARIAAMNEDQSILHEAKAQAVAINRKARVDEMATAFAANRRNTIG